MNREEAVELMCSAVNNMNRKIGEDMLMPSASIEKMIEESSEQLKGVNGMLYDLLASNGVIKESNKN
jgi:hypothetical protein